MEPQNNTHACVTQHINAVFIFLPLPRQIERESERERGRERGASIQM
jgi:hypothetical protein